MKKIIIAVVIILLIFNLLPYLLPVSDGQACMVNLPFGESRIDEIDNISIHSRIWIPNSEIRGKILMIHGLGGSGFSWLKSIDTLVDGGFTVVAADLPGFGYSDRTPGQDHSQKTRSSLLWKLLDIIDSELDAIESADQGEYSAINWNLAGHSMGGGTIAAMAMERGEKTQSLIFVAGAVLTKTRDTVI